jgi:hypothetical protein
LPQILLHRPRYRAQGREYRLALDDGSPRKIKAAEAKTTAPAEERDDDGEQTDKRWQTMTASSSGQQGSPTPAVSFDDLA